MDDLEGIFLRPPAKTISSMGARPATALHNLTDRPDFLPMLTGHRLIVMIPSTDPGVTAKTASGEFRRVARPRLGI